MHYKVTEAFSTTHRRFLAGVEIDEAEIDGPITVERWVEMGRLAPVKENTEPDFAAEQVRLQRAWEAEHYDFGPRASADWPILIADQALYGIVTSADDSSSVDIDIPGEDSRRYPRMSLDVDAGTVSGDYAESAKSVRAAARREARAIERSTEVALEHHHPSGK